MSLIETFLPEPRIRQADHTAVVASRFDAWEAMRAVNLHDLRWIRMLFAARTLPERIAARWRGAPSAAPSRGTIEDIVAPGSGFVLLDQAFGSELVVGAIGRFWQPTIEWRRVPPSAFASFDEPGWGKLAWNLRVDDRRDGGTWLTCELRVTTTDEASWRRMQPYWRLIGPCSHAIRRAVLRRLARRLGEVGRRDLPGDELLAPVQFERTHRRTIDAPPAAVWPWLVQIGGRRAGWYSLDRLDNAGIPSADRIIPELQHLAVGELIPAWPEGDEAFAVLALQPEHALVLGSPSLLPTPPPRQVPEPPYLMTWAFVVDRIGPAASELTIRVRAAYQPTHKMRAASLVIGLEHEIMERAQLRNIARRATASARQVHRAGP